ncbi:MAG: flagellar basal body rod protein FlgC [Ruminococcus sp.]|jgi:flagellar basal-body rod protein FlgC|nr:flagellar basal body rod protein FlgC [Ruminococcus sp.]
MAFLNSLNIVESALSVQRLRMDIIAENIAHQGTTNAAAGEDPYRRQLVVVADKKSFSDVLGEFQNGKSYHVRGTYYLSRGPVSETRGTGVAATAITGDGTPFTPIYDPTHPAADEDGYIYQTNVDNTKEQIDLIAAQQAYEANNAALEAVKGMYNKAMSLTGR